MRIICLKLGGGFLTDKSKPFSFNDDSVEQFVKMLAKVRKKHPEYAWFIGTGAGSFGHYVAKESGYHNNPSDPAIAAKIHQSVVDLNAMVIKLMHKGGIPAFSLQPSAFIKRTNSKTVISREFPLPQMLKQGLVPVVYGDVISDNKAGTSIISTEDVLDVCARQLIEDDFRIEYVVYVTSVDGVLDTEGHVLPSVSRNQDIIEHTNSNFDVTGGIKQKIDSGFRALDYTKNVHIINGNNLSCLDDLFEGKEAGTRIVA